MLPGRLHIGYSSSIMRFVNPAGSSIEVETRDSGAGGWEFRGLAARTDYDYQPWVGSQVSERITGDAFRSINTDNVVMLLDHGGLPLASTRAGTLALSVTSRGLEYRASVPADDPDGARLMAKIRSGAVWGSSMGFYVREQNWDDENQTRIINDLQVFDVSPVGIPANPATDVEASHTSLASELAEIRRMVSGLSEVRQTSEQVAEEIEECLAADALRLRVRRAALADL